MYISEDSHFQKLCKKNEGFKKWYLDAKRECDSKHYIYYSSTVLRRKHHDICDLAYMMLWAEATAQDGIDAQVTVAARSLAERMGYSWEEAQKIAVAAQL